MICGHMSRATTAIAGNNVLPVPLVIGAGLLEDGAFGEFVSESRWFPQVSIGMTFTFR